jgi:inorganic phosphate transporter, PiT family
MGLIMLILIGTVPTAYALNHALPESQIIQFSANSAAASKIVEEKAAGYNILGDPRPAGWSMWRTTRSTKGHIRPSPF